MALVSIANDAQGVVIHTTSRTYRHRATLRRVIDMLCIDHGATLAGRQQAAARWLSKERLVPVYVNPTCILIMTSSLRRFECIAFNYFALDQLRSHQEIQDFLSTNKGKNTLLDCRRISEKMSQDYDIMSYLKGAFADE